MESVTTSSITSVSRRFVGCFSHLHHFPNDANSDNAEHNKNDHTETKPGPLRWVCLSPRTRDVGMGCQRQCQRNSSGHGIAGKRERLWNGYPSHGALTVVCSEYTLSGSSHATDDIRLLAPQALRCACTTGTVMMSQASWQMRLQPPNTNHNH